MTRENDRDIAKRAIDFQTRAKDYPLINVPGYMAWSKRKLAEGVSEALIASLDSRGMLLLPEELDNVGDEVFEELLEDLRSEIGE